MSDSVNQRTPTPQKLFHSIAKRYDLLNNALTLYQIKRWRKEALCAVDICPKMILDVCCGTGEMGVAAREVWPNALIYGIDVNSSMLSVAADKSIYDGLYELDANSALRSRKKFDCAIIAFALYDLGEDRRSSIKNIRDSLDSNGVVVSMELESPSGGLFTIPLRSGMRILKWIFSRIGQAAAAHMLDEVLTSPGADRIVRLFEAEGFMPVANITYFGSVVNVIVFQLAHKLKEDKAHG